MGEESEEPAGSGGLGVAVGRGPWVGKGGRRRGETVLGGEGRRARGAAGWCSSCRTRYHL